MAEQFNIPDLVGKIIRAGVRNEPKFKIERFLSKGGFGYIFIGRHLPSKEEVAVKIEPKEIDHPQLFLENNFYRIIKPARGLPKIYHFGDFDGWSCLIMELLGPSLESKFQECDNKFSLKTTLQISFQLIDIIWWVHGNRVIIRDVKPENFLLGREKTVKQKQIFLIDLGLAKEYIQYNKHIEMVRGKPIAGTIRYMSINAQDGYEQSRRDDLESICYILIYFLRGTLPWMGLDGTDQIDKYKKIMFVKKNTNIEELCKGLPNQIKVIVEHVKNLRFDEEPDYKGIKNKLKDLFESNHFKYDNIYDWDLKKK